MGDETFVALADAQMNGNGNASPVMNGHAVESVENSMVLVDMPVREKSLPKRALKEDTAMYLVRISSSTFFDAHTYQPRVEQERELQCQEAA